MKAGWFHTALIVFFSMMGNAHASVDATQLIGHYDSETPQGITLDIDDALRIQTNFSLTNGVGQIIPIQFPHRLVLNETTGLYETTMLLTTEIQTPGGVVPCQTPITFTADGYQDGNAIDGTFIYSANVFLSQAGQCVGGDIQNFEVGFNRASIGVR